MQLATLQRWHVARFAVAKRICPASASVSTSVGKVNYFNAICLCAPKSRQRNYAMRVKSLIKYSGHPPSENKQRMQSKSIKFPIFYQFNLKIFNFPVATVLNLITYCTIHSVKVKAVPHTHSHTLRQTETLAQMPRINYIKLISQNATKQAVSV